MGSQGLRPRCPAGTGVLRGAGIPCWTLTPRSALCSVSWWLLLMDPRCVGSLSSECCRIWDVVMGLPLPSPASGVRGALGEHVLLVHIAVEMPPCHLVPWLVSWGGCWVREDPSCPAVCRQAQSQRRELGLEM